MQNGDVIAFQGIGIGADAIRMGTRSNYTHIGLVIRIIEIDVDRVFILESTPIGGVTLLPLSRKLESHDGKAWWVPLMIENDSKRFTNDVVEQGVRTMICRWAIKELGKKYNFKLIASIIKKILLRVELPPEEQHEYICSELVARAYKNVGILPNGLNAKLTPDKIINMPVLGSPLRLI
jgi:hypothetical protein